MGLGATVWPAFDPCVAFVRFTDLRTEESVLGEAGGLRLKIRLE